MTKHLLLTSKQIYFVTKNNPIPRILCSWYAFAIFPTVFTLVGAQNIKLSQKSHLCCYHLYVVLEKGFQILGKLNMTLHEILRVVHAYA